MQRLFTLAALLLTSIAVHAQWDIQDAHVTADLRGIHYVGHGVAWASGTNGTVLRTEDKGFVWQLCAIPPGAEKLDFRGIQAFDNNTAIVMSSGKGDLSRLYKTTDGCQTWKLVLTNPDAGGFFDAVVFAADVWGTETKQGLGHPKGHMGLVLGDPVQGNFAIFQTQDKGETWKRWANNDEFTPSTALPKEGAFAASNTSVISPGFHEDFAFVSGGPNGARLMLEQQHIVSARKEQLGFKAVRLPLTASESAGAFSVAARYTPAPKYSVEFMIVGGDYRRPESTAGNAVFVTQADMPQPTLRTPATPPHGYRSAVAYDEKSQTWITVGPNGTDISTDDGRNWRPLKPGPGQPPDADQHWNALSLPFVVGPKGRIGILRSDALKSSTKAGH